MRRSEVEVKIAKENDKYFVYSDGRIQKKGSNLYLSWHFNKGGYAFVCFGHQKYYVHRLVANNFIENPEHLPVVNHKDENPLNNCVDNLEWCSQKYNINYGHRTELAVQKRNYYLEGNTKPIDVYDAMTGRPLFTYLSIQEAIKDIEIGRATMYRILNGIGKWKNHEINGKKYYFANRIIQ